LNFKKDLILSFTIILAAGTAFVGTSLPVLGGWFVGSNAGKAGLAVAAGGCAALVGVKAVRRVRKGVQNRAVEFASKIRFNPI